MKKFAAVMIISSVAVMSCTRYDRDVRKALSYAGENRGQLEKVIEHYSHDKADSLKLKAACYLIGNMLYHRSYPAELYSEYCQEVDSLFLLKESHDIIKDKLDEISRKYMPEMVPVPDVRIATAEFLIRNIDYSFAQWENLPFLANLDFSQFCEYVLPYKCLDLQPLSYWKEEYCNTGRGEMDMYIQFDEMKTNVRAAVETSQQEIRFTIGYEWQAINGIPLLDYIPLCHMPFGTCVERAVLGVLNSRSKGLPVCMDMTPCWGDRNGIHHWNTIIRNRKGNIDFVPFENYPGQPHSENNAYAKAYRYQFSHNRLFVKALRKEGKLHGQLNNIFLHDVTEEYCKTADIRLKVDAHGRKSDFAYLCVYDNSSWTPVALSEIKWGHVTFENVGLGVVYLPVIYENDNMVPVGNPFLLNNCRQKIELNIDEGKVTDMKLLRKYPAFNHIFDVRDYLRGGRIEAADNMQFDDARSMAEFSAGRFFACTEPVTDTTAFRYWRLVGYDDKPGDFAELYFYDRAGGRFTSGKIFSPEMPIRDTKYDTTGNICDNDPLTYLRIEGDTRWAGFDFGRPVSMREVACIRRGDGNDICPGEHYQLYYWDDGGWRLHGERTAESVYLDFDNVPSGGLYLLKCTTSGRQQRIFMYEKGKQVWY